MWAQMASQSTTSTSSVIALDKDRFYCARLNGPAAESGPVPTLEITFALPNEE